jgi:hypothetical protein
MFLTKGLAVMHPQESSIKAGKRLYDNTGIARGTINVAIGKENNIATKKHHLVEDPKEEAEKERP